MTTEEFERARSDWSHQVIQNIKRECRGLLDAGCLVLDTETTGLTNADEIVEICIMDASGATMINTLVRPQQPIPAHVQDIHGITDEMVRTAPTLADIHADLKQIIGNRKVVAYNADFDTRLLRQSCERHQLPDLLPRSQAFCLMNAYSERNGKWDEARQAYKWIRLADACSHMGFEWAGTAHRAASDTHMTLALLRVMAYREG